MSEEQFQASGNWWETPARNMRYESIEQQQQQQQSSSFGGWQQQQQQQQHQHHDTMSASGSSSVVFHDTTQKLQPSDSSTSNNDSNLHMMGLGLSSQTIDWNQASLLGEKASEGSFRSMLQENLNTSSTNFEQETGGVGVGVGVGLSHQVNWRSQEKLFTNESSSNEFKQVNRGFSLDQTQFSPQYSSGDSNMISQMDSSALYVNTSILQGLLGNETNQIQPQHGNNSFENRSMNFPYSTTSYGLSTNELMPSWSKLPHQKQQPNNQLHFTNNAPFWNANSETTIKDASSSFLPPFSTPNFSAQTKNISEGRDSSSVVKKSGSEPAPKRSRNETPSPLPAFKVRKEKMGDRITALQQLVSPFGKTDTASVLSEAIEYIKFLHEQVTVLSTPYMKSGAPIQHQQSSGKSKEAEGPKQDLRSRGLCLVPVSSTFPMTHEPTVEYWTPTFGGTFR
ncbi:transcription factor bHLH123-like isoform X2 [Trifolium pratense]|uniref:transcription factor bHLH123-like isoform X2 n=1 Tax=Trifolium pratense TaxID=57577 RepID=UPI001E691F87|nr:transcription factor bHLH123-like isoform X2 [Trifolium pratense]